MSAQSTQPRGYVGFGSFFSDNVEDLVQQADDQYTPPPTPIDIDELRDFEQAPLLEFGEPARSHFLIDFGTWCFVNHGAFGAAHRVAFNSAHRWRLHAESQPLLHIDRLLFPSIVHSTRVMAAHLKARPTDVVFGTNATSLLNAVVCNAALSACDVVYSLSLGYGSVKKMIKLAVTRCGAQHVEAEVRFPVTRPEDVLSLVQCTLPAATKLAIFDAVTSNTAVALPIAELASLVRSKCPASRVVCDAAHSLGTHAHLDVPSLGVDFWVSNCHKHLCSPRGCAVLWASPAARADLRPVVVSHNTGCGFTSDFIWDGCRDYAPVLVIPQTLRWWAAVGLSRAVAYMHDMLATGVAVLLDAWQTHTLVPMAMSAPTMSLVRLPADFYPSSAAAQSLQNGSSTASRHKLDIETLLARRPPSDDGPASSADAKEWQDALFQRHVECPVKCIQGRLYVRISAHVYNMRADYVRLAHAVTNILGAGAGQ